MKDSDPKPRYPPRSQFFAFVLYPQEDITHKKLVEILLSPAYYKDVRLIEHNRDYIFEHDETLDFPIVETKKAHTHVLFHTSSRLGVDQVSAITGLATHEIEVVRSAEAFKLYMLHLDFQSQINGKTPYNESELKGGLPFFDNNRYDDEECMRQVITMVDNGISYRKLIILLTNQHKLNFLRKYRQIICDLYEMRY